MLDWEAAGELVAEAALMILSTSLAVTLGGAGGLKGYPFLGVTFLSRSGSCLSWIAYMRASLLISRFSLSDMLLLGVLASSSIRDETLLVPLADGSLMDKLGGIYLRFSVSFRATGLIVVSPSESESSSVLMSSLLFS